MLMMGPNKKTATLIVSKMRGSDKEDFGGCGHDEPSYRSHEEEEVELDGSSGLKSAARAVMSSIDSGDESRLVDAMSTFVELCFENIQESKKENEDSEEYESYGEKFNKEY